MKAQSFACGVALLTLAMTGGMPGAVPGAVPGALAAASPDHGQSPLRVADNPAPAGDAPAPAPAEPQRTAATFADWVVRCDHAAGSPPRKACEAVQTFTVRGKDAPFAQLAFAPAPPHPEAPGSLMVVLIMPVNLALDSPPVLTTASGDHAFQFQRCLPDGCAASLLAGPDMIRELRGAAKGGMVSFVDAARQKVNLPMSTRGFPQALDDLAKEIATR